MGDAPLTETVFSDAVFTDTLLHAAVLVVVVAMLFPPLAWAERWAALAPLERERFAKDPLLPLLNALKLLGKRAMFPSGDVVLHVLAPLMALTPTLFVIAALPVLTAVVDGERVVVAPVLGPDVPWLLVFAILLVSPASYLVAARAARNPLAILGALRLAVVRASMLLVFALSTAGVLRALNSRTLEALVQSETTPLVDTVPALGALVNPLGFFASFFAVVVFVARSSRQGSTPRGDLVEGHVMVAAGPLSLAQRVFEIVDLLALSGLLATVFFGGAWVPPSIVEPATAAHVVSMVVLVGKSLVVAVLVLLVRRALPPLQHDQALRTLWLGLLPLALFALFLGAFLAARSG